MPFSSIVHPSKSSILSPAHLPLPSQKLIQSSLLHTSRLSSKSTSCTRMYTRDFITSPYILKYFFSVVSLLSSRVQSKYSVSPRLNLSPHLPISKLIIITQWVSPLSSVPVHFMYSFPCPNPESNKSCGLFPSLVHFPLP